MFIEEIEGACLSPAEQVENEVDHDPFGIVSEHPAEPENFFDEVVTSVAGAPANDIVAELRFYDM